MDTIQAEALEEKLKTLLRQLEAEHAVFERMVYKNKNQHRRCSYFQYLLKVRRDLRLLRTANMDGILGSCFHVITGKKPKQTIHLLESLKWKRCDTGKSNFLERLLGAVRLLSQMTEPILRAASEISTLLACSFFMGFSATFLALLARLRAVVQQILLDSVSVFNTVFSMSQKKQYVKITQDGVEVYREFYPKAEDYITLECIWKTDKYVLHEALQKRGSGTKQGDVSEGVSNGELSVRYQSIESFLGEDGSSLAETDGDLAGKESLSPIKEALPSETNNGSQIEGSERTEVSTLPVNPEKSEAVTIKPHSSARKVAFLSVKRPAPSSTNAVEPPLKKACAGGDENKEGDGFYNLLVGGTLKDSLF